MEYSTYLYFLLRTAQYDGPPASRLPVVRCSSRKLLRSFVALLFTSGGRLFPSYGSCSAIPAASVIVGARSMFGANEPMDRGVLRGASHLSSSGTRTDSS